MGFLCTRGLRRAVLVILVVTLLGATVFASSASAGSASGLVPIGAGLKGRAGLSASVAAEGLTNVSAVAFDDDGRLWALTAGYEDDGTDALSVVPSTGATPVTVLTGLHTPMG